MKLRPSLIATSLVFAIAAALPVLGQSSRAPDMEAAWAKVAFEKRDHSPLLKRQAALPAEPGRRPVAIALLVLDPDVAGMVTDVATKYDSMENPSEVEISVTERGLMDDDLLAIRHVLSLARNSNNEWRVVGYRRGELRRVHLK